ncbi:MAG: hypothetical protein R2725_05165 [Solirubrobacterales bacterium]
MASNALRLDPEDEYSHPPDDLVNFNESVYASGWQADAKMGGWMRLGNRVNEGYAELSVCLYLPDGRVACQFGRPSIEANDGFEAGGLRYSVQEPFKAMEMSYEGDLLVLEDPELLRDPTAMFETAPRADGEVRFEIRGVSPVHGGEPTAPEHERLMYYGPQFSRGHFNQHTGVRGLIRVGEEEFPLADAFGWRDHSWGPRYWQAIWAYRLLIANFGPDRAFMLLKNMYPDGSSRRLGVLQIDDRYLEITDLDIRTEWTDSQDPGAIWIGARTAEGTAVIEGRTLTLAPLRNRRKTETGELLISRVAEAFTEYTWEGRTGYGVMEYIERVEDGAAVGYPL